MARAEEGPALRLVDDPGSPDFGSVVVGGLPEAAVGTLAGLGLDRAGWEALLSVRTAAAAADGLPAVLGSHTAAGGAIRFRPRFPFRAGLAYHCRFDGRLFDVLTGAAFSATPDLELVLELPPPPGRPAPRVEAVYPTAAEVPANLLRLYVHFSTPMRTKGVERFVRLVDGSGAEVPLPFVEVEHGLWDPAARRLTLFFHPGRIKRGVGPHLALGPPLEEGRTYRLVIDAGLADAGGRPLAGGFEKELRAGPADRSSPDPASWRLAAPDAGGRLTLDFPEPLDRALLARLVTVHDAAGNPVRGAGTVERAETRWSFRPALPWRPGRYFVRVDPAIEDLAGNTPTRLFDEESAPAAPTPGTERPVELAFEVGPPDGAQSGD